MVYADEAELTVSQVNGHYTTANATFTLYAVWAQDTYTIEFNGNKPNNASANIKAIDKYINIFLSFIKPS